MEARKEISRRADSWLYIYIEYVEVEKKYSLYECNDDDHHPIRTNNAIRELSCTTNSIIWHEIIFHYRSF